MRRIPERRFDDLIDGATDVFIECGYRRTQMADVAEAVGVAQGTLCAYVESKEALFALCLRFADHSGPVERPEVLPVPTPPTGSLEVQVKQRMADESVPQVLSEALAKPRAADPRAELESIVRALYTTIEANRMPTKSISPRNVRFRPASVPTRESVTVAFGGYFMRPRIAFCSCRS